MVRSVPLSAVLALLAAVSVVSEAWSQESAEKRNRESTQPLSYTWGSDDAAVVVIEFVDFGCSACAAFHETSRDTLFREYVDEGNVRWTFVPFVSGQFLKSMEAAEAASCAAHQPGGLEAMTARLFETQDDWRRLSDPVTLFLEHAEELGLDVESLEACMRGRETRDGIRAAGERALELGVRATPTFFMDGFPIPGNLPLDFFRQLFDKRLAGGVPQLR